ncbi:MAG: hypothetical protein IV100_07020 [Myxococcales bacterium]|nr:hypothetical protein [Myxococcales bacterium]
MLNRSHLWLVAALSLPLGCKDSTSSSAASDAEATADNADTSGAADAADAADAASATDASDATDGADGADAADGADEKQPCGWNPDEAFYACGYPGADPSGVPIACPANAVGGDECWISGLTAVGCCDANGDVMYCTEEKIIELQECTPD